MPPVKYDSTQYQIAIKTIDNPHLNNIKNSLIKNENAIAKPYKKLSFITGAFEKKSIQTNQEPGNTGSTHNS
jgi:hypothetical protein